MEHGGDLLPKIDFGEIGNGIASYVLEVLLGQELLVCLRLLQHSVVWCVLMSGSVSS
jgi:hypothetical protein